MAAGVGEPGRLQSPPGATCRTEQSVQPQPSLRITSPGTSRTLLPGPLCVQAAHVVSIAFLFSENNRYGSLHLLLPDITRALCSVLPFKFLSCAVDIISHIFQMVRPELTLYKSHRIFFFFFERRLAGEGGEREPNTRLDLTTLGSPEPKPRVRCFTD